jgi:hypothetical protein
MTPLSGPGPAHHQNPVIAGWTRKPSPVRGSIAVCGWMPGQARHNGPGSRARQDGSRRRRPARSYSAFAPVSLITLPQRGISLRIQLPNCSGVLATTSNSISCSRCVISGERMIFTSSRL